LRALNIYSWTDLEATLRGHEPALIAGARTSTVIPFEKIPQLDIPEKLLIDLSGLPKTIQVDTQAQAVQIEGPVSWQEVRAELNHVGFDLLAWPTEESAFVLSGLATSATGERSFGHGTLREQVLEVNYYDGAGELHRLLSSNSLEDFVLFSSPENKLLLHNYQKSYQPYLKFKNAPFPRLCSETDLMCGSEGQLGLIRSALLSITPNITTAALVIKLPLWIEDFSLHLEIFHFVQTLRSDLMAVEFLDSNSLMMINDPRFEGADIIYLECAEDKIEDVFEKLMKAEFLLNEDDIFMVSHSKIKELRMAVPRAVSDLNARRGLNKLGTDVQVAPIKMKELLTIYQGWSKLGLDFILFGHFGDAHLHFNFLTSAKDRDRVLSMLKEFYHDVKNLKGSPFAEHGIGFLKRDFIAQFHSEIHQEMFVTLKKYFDPHQQFYPSGYMSPRGKR
jgi:FAD/FMN-containing dehydrogenase